MAKLAARIYAPLGTGMSLGDYVRVVRTFLEAFKLAELHRNGELLSGSDNEPESNTDDLVVTRVVKLEDDLKVRHLIVPCDNLRSSVCFAVLDLPR